MHVHGNATVGVIERLAENRQDAKREEGEESEGLNRRNAEFAELDRTGRRFIPDSIKHCEIRDLT